MEGSGGIVERWKWERRKCAPMEAKRYLLQDGCAPTVDRRVARGPGKKRGQQMREKLLFIAPTVPLFDRNAGDLRLFTILTILSKSYDITYLAKNFIFEESIDNKFYVSSLSDFGITVYIGNFSIKKILQSNRFKAAFLEFYHIAELYLQKIKLLQPSCPVVVDSVDVHYLRFLRKCQITNDVNDIAEMEETKKRELAIYSQADITITVTEEDARSLIKENNNITAKILPTVHQLIHSTSSRNENQIVFVGGFGHEPNIDAVVYFCENILSKIRKVIPDARFTIVGNNPPQQIRNLGNDFITVTGYVPSTTPYLQKSRVSVAPLRYGAGMKGKIGEAMAHGLPVVTTSIGAEGMGLTDRENIIVADSPEAFSNAVVELMLDNNLYNKIQKNAIEHISNNFTPEIIGMKMERILKGLDELHIKKLSIASKIYLFVNYALNNVKSKLHFHA
jgi:glycosyltransferase involved in cell wall biosynthesis